MTELDRAPIDWNAILEDSRRKARVHPFENQEAEYAAWMTRNQGGFVVAVIGRDAMIHTSLCSHIQPDGDIRNTGNKKFCSNDEKLLVESAREKYGEVARCQDCG